jgi:hypothetical protein
MKPTFDSIARAIVFAQICSDAGKNKHIVFLDDESDMLFHEKGYRKKGYWILRAINMIDAIPPCGVRYYIEKVHRGMAIVYFLVKLDNKWRQISFHCPSSTWSERENLEIFRRCGKGSRIFWDHKIGGSIKTALAIEQYLNDKN